MDALFPYNVVIAGAGPGDETLITLKLQQRLQNADVIITDRLVNPLIIANNASINAVIIQAGKQGYNDASYTQNEINALIVKYALEGKKILRLKGGDVAFFSNVLDELQVLVENNLSYEIIPGITAASGASAYAGIPLTARGYAQGVQFVTFNPNSIFTDLQWKALANTDDTLVCYMVSKNLSAVAELLLSNGAELQKPLAVIEQATTLQQKVYISSLKNCATDFASIEFLSPSLVIIGNVIHLHKEFAWFTANEPGTIFNELEK